MAAAAPVTVTRTVTLDPLAPAATEPAPAPNGATVIYVTRTREPTPTPTPEVCSAFVCPSDCDDWACFEASFGANGTPGEDGCPSFVQCIDYRCSHGESFSYDLALLWRDTCGEILPAERVRAYPTPLPPPKPRTKTTAKSTTTVASTTTLSTTTKRPVPTTTTTTTTFDIQIRTSTSTLQPTATTTAAATTNSSLGVAVIIPIAIACLITFIAAILGTILFFRKWKARVYKTAAAIANKEVPPPMSPADEKGYYARSTYARSVVPDHMSSMGSPRTPIYTAPSMPPTVYHPHYTPEDIRAALEQRAKQSSRSRSRSRAPSRAGSEIQGPRYVDRFDDTRSMRSASRGRLLDERDRRMLEERSRGSWMEHEAVSPASSRVRSEYYPEPPQINYVAPPSAYAPSNYNNPASLAALSQYAASYYAPSHGLSRSGSYRSVHHAGNRSARSSAPGTPVGSGSRIGSPVLAPVPSESNYAPSEASVSFAARVGLGMTNDDVIGSYASPLPTAAEEDEEEERASGPEQDL